MQWKFAAGDVVLGAVAAGEDRLFFAARDGYVYAVSIAGKELGRWNAHAPIVASPALSGGMLYVVTETGKLYGLRADDLELVWEATLGFTGPFLSSPAVARGHVYVGSQQDGLLCVGKPGGRKQEPCWAGSLGGPGCGGAIDNQPLPEKGKFAWRFPKTEDTERPPDVQLHAPPACLGGCLYLPVHGGRNGLALRQCSGRRSVPDTIQKQRAPGSLVCRRRKRGLALAGRQLASGLLRRRAQGRCRPPTALRFACRRCRRAGRSRSPQTPPASSSCWTAAG